MTFCKIKIEKKVLFIIVIRKNTSKSNWELNLSKMFMTLVYEKIIKLC